MFELLKGRLNAGKIAAAVLVIGMVACLLPPSAHCARPLITDDAGTLGKGKFQVELGFETSDHRTDDDGVVTKEDSSSATATVSYGILENLDIVLGAPHQWTKVKEDGESVSDENGFSDVTLEAKWRFFEKNGYSLALKPGLSFPTGDDKRGLGTGRMTCGMIFIATKEMDPFTFNLNAGYRRNENDTDERKDIWGADLAGEVQVFEPIKLVANVGVSTNTDRQSSTAPAFFLGGLIYSVTENVDIDLGYKKGLNKAESDNTCIGGVTIKF